MSPCNAGVELIFLKNQSHIFPRGFAGPLWRRNRGVILGQADRHLTVKRAKLCLSLNQASSKEQKCDGAEDRRGGKHMYEQLLCKGEKWLFFFIALQVQAFAVLLYRLPAGPRRVTLRQLFDTVRFQYLFFLTHKQHLCVNWSFLWCKVWLLGQALRNQLQPK